MKRQFYASLIKILLILVCIFSGPAWAGSAKPSAAAAVTIRNDGLTLAVRPLPKEEQDLARHYLTMIVKTGAAHDPAAKSGLTTLTNELLYLIFHNSSALQVEQETAPDFSIFHFTVANADFGAFLKELDGIIRLEALTLYDQCNELILAHRNEPVVPGYNASVKLAELIYGPSHPYRCGLTPDYKQLTISDVNNWFRKIYRPNNLIVASSRELPEDFLRRPSGRDMKSAVNPPEVPPAKGNALPEAVFCQVRDNVSTVRIGLSAPKMNEAGFFPALLACKYLEQELWQVIREESGYCYDLRVTYSYLPHSAAPDLVISFQTLPAETDQAVLKTLAVLESAAAGENPRKYLAAILDREKRLVAYRDQSGRQVVRNAAFQALTGLTWFGDSSEYLAKLCSIKASDVSQWIASSLPRIKIAVAGPAEVEKLMEPIHEKVKAMGEAASPMPTPPPRK